MARPVSQIFAEEGLAGLEALPGIGHSLARTIRDLLRNGKLVLLDRLRGDHDPLALLRSVPGIGPVLGGRLHEELGLETLEELESAAHDGRLETLAGLGPKRLAGIRDSLAHRLGRLRRPPVTPVGAPVESGDPPVGELLEVDAEYRRGVAADTLKKLAPRRFNPTREAWLPVLHTTRGTRHYTALFSNSARAHERHQTRDWVVLYCDGPDGERQFTVITAAFGRLKGRRIVRGREAECAALAEGRA